MSRLLIASLMAASAFCQSPASTDPLDAVKNDFMLVSTHASALFESADSIDANLHADGSTLHPATITLRHRIERTLNQAQVWIDKGDGTSAAKSIRVAEELVRRYARRIGGE